MMCPNADHWMMLLYDDVCDSFSFVLTVIDCRCFRTVFASNDGRLCWNTCMPRCWRICYGQERTSLPLMMVDCTDAHACPDAEWFVMRQEVQVCLQWWLTVLMRMHAQTLNDLLCAKKVQVRLQWWLIVLAHVHAWTLNDSFVSCSTNCED